MVENLPQNVPQSPKPRAKPVPHRKALATLSFSAGNRIYSEDHFINALAPLGMTRRAFRSLCKALSVPLLEIGSTKLVDAFSFSLALHAILRIGEPDFYAPTSSTLSRGKRPPSSATSLDPAHVQKHITILISELLCTRKLSGLAFEKQTTEAARDAAKRMALAGFQRLPTEARDNYARRAVARAHRQGII